MLLRFPIRICFYPRCRNWFLFHANPNRNFDLWRWPPNLNERNQHAKYIVRSLVEGHFARKSLSRHTTRSTGTVHTYAKARLTSVAIRIPICIWIRDRDRHQNVTVCSLAHCQPSLKISCKSGQKLLNTVANRQTDKQTTTIAHPPCRR